MNNLGIVFKKLRKSRNLSQEASKGVISKSTLSEFENGKHEIKISSFYALINNISISLEEFEYIANDYELKGFKQVWLKAIDFYNDNKISALRTFLLKEELKQEDGNIYDELIIADFSSLFYVFHQGVVLVPKSRYIIR